MMPRQMRFEAYTSRQAKIRRLRAAIIEDSAQRATYLNQLISLVRQDERWKEEDS